MTTQPVSLRTYTTMKIGGSVERLLKLSDVLSPSQLPRPLRILGNGSNVLIDDHGLKGSVILTRDFDFMEPEILTEDEESMTIEASAGAYLPAICKWAQKHSLSGCEYMVGVPGTLGGAVLQNAGANGQELSEILLEVQTINLKTDERSRLAAKDCEMTYRYSILKSQPEILVTKVVLELKKGNASEIQNKIDENLRYRKEKTPYSKPSLGSVFTRLKNKVGEWIFPGKLIEDAKLKGLRMGGAEVSKIHANYIVNEGQASFDEVFKLMNEIEKRVFDHSGQKLKREILVWSDRQL